MLSKFFSRIVLAVSLVSCVLFMACETNSLEKMGSQIKEVSRETKKQEIKAELVPFDRYPIKPNFSIAIKFSHPVAPSLREQKENFESLQMNPNKPGVWSWWSDSILIFTPHEAWLPGVKFDLDLKGLVTTKDQSSNPLVFSPTLFSVSLPSPQVNISECKLVIKNRSPLVQTPKIEMRFNYPMQSNKLTSYLNLSLTGKDRSESLNPTWSSQLSGMLFNVSGADIFRPAEPGTVKLSLKKGMILAGNHALVEDLFCEIPISPESWDKIADAKAVESKEKPLTIVTAAPPIFQIGNAVDTRYPLRITFKEPWSTSVVPHGKAKGLTLDKGIEIVSGEVKNKNLSRVNDKAIEGIWKTDDYLDYVINFIPTSPWPVGEKLTIVLNQDIFPEVKLRELEAPIQIPNLHYNFTNTQFYTNPSDPLDRKFVSTIEFSHPVDLTNLSNSISIKYRIEPNKSFSGPNAKELKSKVTQDEKALWKYYVESERVELPNEPGEIRLEVAKGLTALSGGVPNLFDNSTNMQVPSKLEVFNVTNIGASIITRPDQKVERVISLELSEPTELGSVQSNLEAYLLPDCSIEKNAKICREQSEFGQEDVVTKEVLIASQKLTLSPLPKDEETQPNLFAFSFEAPGNRELFLSIHNKLTSKNNFQFKKDFRKVLYVSEFEKQLKIMHEGSLLSLSGAKKLGINFRNIKKVKYELSRILPENVHHLVSATYDNLTKPDFNYYSFALDQLAESVSYTENIPSVDSGKAQYSVVNFERFMKKGKSPNGLFYLNVKEETEKKEATDSDAECVGDECDQQPDCYSEEGYCDSSPLEDKRLVLLTDLGIIVKNSLNDEKDLFVMSFNSGTPVSGATVKLVGQNGIALFTKTTDSGGKVSFPSTKDLKREKVPLMYVVEKGDDYSFLPFSKGERSLDFSKFSTEGVMNEEEAEGLRAMIFSDRGIYRPGEEAKFGIIVRKRNLEPVLGQIPLEVTLSDPRGIEILKQKFSLSKLGFDDFRWLSENALSGTYNLSVSLVRGKNNDKKFLLGSTSFRVDEFQPDKLAVRSRYVAEVGEKQTTFGWSKLNGKIEVGVRNLFGTPAVDNKVVGLLNVKPWDGKFPLYPVYDFYPKNKDLPLNREPENLGELQTDSEGVVNFSPELAKYAEGAFSIQFAGEAFEKDSGRSVLSSFESLISDANSFVGWKVDGSLAYVNKGSVRLVKVLAVDPGMKSVTLPELHLELIETKMISTLIKQPNGSLSYEMTPKKEVVSKTDLSIAEGTVEEGGANFKLETNQAGSFALNIRDKDGKLLNSIEYTVYGEGNSSFMSDRSNEVGIKLARSSVLPDEELEIAINTPYVGSGLITIERDKVYAYKWFKVDSLSSVQTIKVPKDIIGNAYLSISFVRSLDSKEIFSSPLSYGVKPFFIAKSEYTAGIKLDAPEKVRPGGDVEIVYEIDSPGRFLIYAVDEGILQFAKYKNPRPVDSFVPKRALEVSTLQILDMLLPEYSIVEALSKVGGDEDYGLGKFKNPFARKKRPPVAFWSGILPEGVLKGNVKIPIPEYFNGTLRIIAVAVTANKLGAETKSLIAQNEFVIDPQAPYFVSPGDEFEIGATVANTVLGSGKEVKLIASISPNEALEVIDNKPVELIVPEGEDKVFRIKARAKDVLGEKDYKIKVIGLGKEYSISDSLSIRPASVMSTTLASGISRPDIDKANSSKEFVVDRNLYSDLRDVKASISYSPLSVGHALVSYLKEYPYGCTEQLISSAFPAILFGPNAEMGLDVKDVDRFSKRAFSALSSRQKADGSFGLWDLNSDSDGLYSIYATHFLIEARERDFDIPSETYDRAIEHLKAVIAHTEYSSDAHLLQSYALYLLARSGNIVTKDAQMLVTNLDRQWKQNWKNTLISAFLAGTFKVLQMDKEADELLQKLPEIWKPSFGGALNDPGLYGALYTYISFKHFQKEKWLSPLDTVVPIDRMLEDRSYSSFNASYSLLGLSSYSEKMETLDDKGLKISAWGKGNNLKELELSGHGVLSALVPELTEKINYSGPKDKVYFYSLNQTGFDRGGMLAKEQGITIEREYRNLKNELVEKISLKDKLEVTLFIKSEEWVRRVAAVELIPGGFEIDLSESGLANRKSSRTGPNTWSPTFIEIQEDRIIFFGDLPADSVNFSYKLKPVSRGQFKFPAPYVEAMYDLKKGAVGKEQSLEVE